MILAIQLKVGDISSFRSGDRCCNTRHPRYHLTDYYQDIAMTAIRKIIISQHLGYTDTSSEIKMCTHWFKLFSVTVLRSFGPINPGIVVRGYAGSLAVRGGTGICKVLLYAR